MSLIQSLEWRYATKRMTGEVVPQEKLDFILHATQLSASSYGLQPYKILVISNAELKKQLQPHAYNQPQIAECSHLLVFAAWTSVSAQQIATYIENVATTRALPTEALAGFQQYLSGAVLPLDASVQQAWTTKQAYIALGTALAAAGEAQVDATPMEGFVPDAFDEVLGLKEKGLHAVVLLALGYRSEEDVLAKAAKVRRDASQLFEVIA